MKNGVKMDHERAHKERRPSPEPGQSTGEGSHLFSCGGWLVSMLQDHLPPCCVLCGGFCIVNNSEYSTQF